MANAAALRSHLAERRGAKIDGVHRNCRRAFRAAVAFVGPDAEMIFEGLGNAIRQFLSAGHHEAEAAELFGSAAARVRIQEGRSGKQHGDGILVHQCADNSRIERIRMKNHADARRSGQTQRARKTKGMEKRARCVCPLRRASAWFFIRRSEEHTSELQSRQYLVCRLLLEKKK